MATLIPLAVVALAGPAIIALVFYRNKRNLFGDLSGGCLLGFRWYYRKY